MAATPNTVRRESLRVTTESEALALAVRAELVDLNRRTLIPIVERVLEEFDVASTHVRIPRLDIDLGTILAADLERMLPSLFERELREQLRRALRADEIATETSVRSTEAARLEAIEQYLMTGTLPFWASHAPFDLDEMLSGWLTTDPAAVARLFRRRGAAAALVRRTVQRLSETTLRRLLHVLAPDDAAVIIVYMAEIREFHAAEPLIEAADDEVARVVWIVALTYVLHDPGSQFNRTTLLRSMLEGLAREEHASYSEILAVFARALEGTSRRLPIGSTLLAAVAVLVEQEVRVDPWFAGVGRRPRREDDGRPQPVDPTQPQRDGQRSGTHVGLMPPSRYEQVDALRYWLRHGIVPWTAVLRDPGVTADALVAQLPSLSFTMLQSLAVDRSADEQIRGWRRLIARLSEEALARLVQQIVRHLDGRTVVSIAGLETRALDGNAAEVYAREIAALLHGGAVASPPDRPWLTAVDQPFAVDSREPDRLKSLLLSRATAAVPPTADREAPSARADAGDPVGVALRDDAEAMTPAGDAGDQPSALDVAPSAPAQVEPDDIRAALRDHFERLRAAAGDRVPASLDATPTTDALVALVEADGLAARQWLKTVRRAGIRTAALVDAPPTDMAVRSVASILLPPAAAAGVEVLLAALAELPPGERPGSLDAIHAEVLREMLAHDEGAAPGAVLVAVLGRLFGTAPPASVLDRLMRTAARMAGDGRISASAAEMVDAVRTELLGRGDGTGDRAAAGERTTERPALKDDRATALGWLRRGATDAEGGRVSDDVLRHGLREALEHSADAVRVALLAQIDDPRARRRWAATLGESELARLVMVVDARRGRALLDAAELLFAAWAVAAGTHATAGPRRIVFWTFILGFLAATGDADRSLERLTEAFLAHVERETSHDDGQAIEGSLIQSVRAAARRLAENAGNAALRAVLSRDRRIDSSGANPLAPGARRPVPAGARVPPANRERSSPPIPLPSRRRTAFSMDGGEVVEGEPIYVSNAGLVLTARFLPHLFQSLEMLETTHEGRAQIRPTQVSRAVHLVQWLVDARTSAPEPLLCLNKLLCGVPIATPIAPAIEPTPREIEIGTLLLRSMLAHWAALQNTSLAGLRETFLQRDGRLEKVPHGWRLQVDRKTVDVLLSSLPWPISTVVHSLMPEPIFVTW